MKIPILSIIKVCICVEMNMANEWPLELQSVVTIRSKGKILRLCILCLMYINDASGIIHQGSINKLTLRMQIIFPSIYQFSGLLKKGMKRINPIAV
jgi:hypothetical protein